MEYLLVDVIEFREYYLMKYKLLKEDTINTIHGDYELISQVLNMFRKKYKLQFKRCDCIFRKSSEGYDKLTPINTNLEDYEYCARKWLEYNYPQLTNSGVLFNPISKYFEYNYKRLSYDNLEEDLEQAKEEEQRLKEYNTAIEQYLKVFEEVDDFDEDMATKLYYLLHD